MRLRLVCRLLGCRDAEMPECSRCGEYYYGRSFIEVGLLSGLYWWARWFILCLVGRKCDVCGRRFWRGYSSWCCSEECFRDWVPF